MEKYRSSADPSTGIHPFLPTAQLPSTRIMIQGLMLYPMRLPAGLVLVVFYIAIHLLASALHFVLVHEPAFALDRFASILLQLALLCVGVQSSAPTGRLPRMPSHGDLVFTSHASYLDVLYLIAALCPAKFAVPRSDGQLALLRPHAALLWALRGGGDAPASATTLTDSATAARRGRAGPVVVFGEGGSTNGSGVLRFAPPVNRVVGECFALGMRYSRSRMECFTVGSGGMHLTSLLASLGASLGSRIAHVPDAAAIDLQREVARLAEVPALAIGLEARVKFIAHWASTAGGRGIEQYKR